MESVLGGFDLIDAGRQREDAVRAIGVGCDDAVDGQSSARHVDLRAGNSKALFVFDDALDGGSSLRSERESKEKQSECQAKQANHRMFRNSRPLGTLANGMHFLDSHISSSYPYF